MGIKHRSEGGQGQSRRRGELLQSARAARGAATPRKRNCATWNWKRAEEENSVFVGLKHATGECNRRWNAGMGWDLESVLIRLPALSRDVGKHRQRSVGSIIRAGQDRTDRQLGAIEVAASQRGRGSRERGARNQELPLLWPALMMLTAARRAHLSLSQMPYPVTLGTLHSTEWNTGTYLRWADRKGREALDPGGSQNDVQVLGAFCNRQTRTGRGLTLSLAVS